MFDKFISKRQLHHFEIIHADSLMIAAILLGRSWREIAPYLLGPVPSMALNRLTTSHLPAVL